MNIIKLLGVSPYSHTIESLYTTFDALNLNTVKYLTDAGYETYWISNQEEIGIYDTGLKLLSLFANHTIYKSNQKQQYDEVLLPEIKIAINGDKKLFLRIYTEHILLTAITIRLNGIYLKIRMV